MSAGSDPHALASRLDQLEERYQQLGRQCRNLKYALAILAVVALATPAVLMLRTSFGSELRTGTVIADRFVLSERGELVVEGDKPGKPKARLGYFSEGGWYGLALFDGENPAVRLRGGDSPSLTFQAKRGGESQLRLGYTGTVGPGVTDVVGEPMVELVGPGGVRQASLSVAGNGDPHLVLFDLDGQRRCVDISVSSLFSRVTLRSRSEKEKLRRLELSSFPKVEFLDEEGRLIEPTRGVP